MRLFLDANILFAAAISPSGRSQALFSLSDAGYGNLLTSAFAADEARRNVKRKYPDAGERLESLLQACGKVPEGQPERLLWASQYVPAKDAPILAAAVAARADLLVTGDRAHFGALYGRRFEATEVVSLAAALERLVALDRQD